jgi:acyl-homoserine-lactone acylase
VKLLRGWDLRWGAGSVPTSLAVFWGEDLRRRAGGPDGATPDQMLQSLAAASALPAPISHS